MPSRRLPHQHCERPSRRIRQAHQTPRPLLRTRAPKNKQKVNTLGDGLFEFKTIGGLRLIGFWDANRIILCTHGFLKKRQTTPPAELATATKWKKAYETAKKANKLKFSGDNE